MCNLADGHWPGEISAVWAGASFRHRCVCFRFRLYTLNGSRPTRPCPSSHRLKFKPSQADMWRPAYADLCRHSNWINLTITEARAVPPCQEGFGEGTQEKLKPVPGLTSARVPPIFNAEQRRACTNPPQDWLDGQVSDHRPQERSKIRAVALLGSSVSTSLSDSQRERSVCRHLVPCFDQHPRPFLFLTLSSLLCDSRTVFFHFPC